MGKFTATAEDVARGTLVRPGWWPFEIKGVEDKPGKEKPSTTVTHVSMTIERAEDDEGNVVTNIPIMAYFPDTNPSGAIPFARAFGIEIGKTGAEFEIDERYIGKRAEVYVTRGTFNNRGTNQASDFRAIP